MSIFLWHGVRSLLKVALAAWYLVPVPGWTAAAQAQTAAGKVTISYTLTRINKIASNQFAVWVEDEAGRYIRTLFATDFMARRQGWKIRQEICPIWIKAADVKNTPQQDIDAVSSPTPQSGILSVVWNLKDAKGMPLSAGVYVYRIEGNLYWENTVVWTGKIRVGGARETSLATVSYSPEGADKQGTLISVVSAVYEPDSAAAIHENRIGNSQPGVFQVYQNFPNPFNSGTAISYRLFRPAEVKLDVFSLLGTPVRRIVSGSQNAGFYRVYWDGRTEDNLPAASGIYFARFLINHCSETVSMQLLK